MGMKPSGRKGFNPVAAAGIDIGAMMTVPATSVRIEDRVEHPALAAEPADVVADERAETLEALVDEPVAPQVTAQSAVPLVAKVASSVAAQLQEPAAAVSSPPVPRTPAARPSRAQRRSSYEPGAVVVDLEPGAAPKSGRYLWHIDQGVFDAAERERKNRNIPTWGEYFIAVLAQHARELDTLFPSLGYDLDVFGLGVMARRGYRKHDQPTAIAAVYLPRGRQGEGLAEVIERYAARARSKSAFAQQLVEHHLKVEGLL